METPNPSHTNPFLSYDIEESNKYSFKIQFKINENKITILALDKNSIISSAYKLEFSFDDCLKLDKYFKRCDSLTELYEYLSDIEIEKNTTIELEQNFIKLIISFPTGLIKNPFKKINFMLPKIEMKESDIILKLCEKVKEIDILKEKISFLFNYLNINEKDFERYKQLMPNLNCQEIINKSNIITNISELKIPLEGIYKNLNKKIKEIKLLYKAMRDGDQAKDFHSRCDVKENTLIFIKSTNEKKCGGFSTVAWARNDEFINNKNGFLFSLDNKKCYFYKNNGDIYGYSNNGQIFWFGNRSICSNDIGVDSGFLSKKNINTCGASDIYDGNKYALSGEEKFQTVDLETYQVMLE